jgi:hypothetical protein
MRVVIKFLLLFLSMTIVAAGTAPKKSPKRADSIRKDLDSNERLSPNNMFLPGGNREAGSFIAPIISYSSISGFGAGVFTYKSWGEYGAGASAFVTSETGAYYALRLRRHLYESILRRWNVEANLLGRTIKNIRYSVTDGIKVQEVTVEDTDFSPGASLGGTYRWRVDLPISAEGFVFYNPFTKNETYDGSLFIETGLFKELRGFAGWVVDRPSLGLRFHYIMLGYDIEDDLLFMQLQGLVF